jgi:hypothetical protein
VPKVLSTLKSEFNKDGEDDEDSGEGSENAEVWDNLLVNLEDNGKGSEMDTESDVD